MTTQVPNTSMQMKSETLDSMQDLVRTLRESHQYLLEAAESVKNDEAVTKTLREISEERRRICDEISSYVELADEEPAKEGSFLWEMRKLWSSFRAALNGGEPKVVLIEAERAEDAILKKFKMILPEIAGNPISDKLNEFFTNVKHGHDRILAFRNAYQTK